MEEYQGGSYDGYYSEVNDGLNPVVLSSPLTSNDVPLRTSFLCIFSDSRLTKVPLSLAKNIYTILHYAQQQ